MNKQLQNLRNRAEAFLEANPQQKTISYDDVYKMSREIRLQQIEIQLQNEDLQNTLLELEQIKNRHSDLYDFIPFAYFAVDVRGIIIETNQAAANLIGVKKEHILSQSFLRYVAPNFHHNFSEYFKQATQNEDIQTCELKLMRREGPLFDAQLDSKSLTNVVTEEKYLLIFAADISNRKEKEHYSHVHQYKMAYFERQNSINEFATIIAHELNQPLAVISNYLHGTLRRLEKKDFVTTDIIKALRQAADQTHRVSEIMLRMKNFTCKGSIQYEPICINKLINDAMMLINYEIADFPTTIHYKPVKNLPFALIDKIHIEQVLINLCRNAVEAMRDARVSEPKVIIEVNQVSVENIEISIIDNGPGIPLETRHKLFNPHFTTKPYGIGIGLAVCYAIIESHGGSLTIDANPVGGACFKFTLPLQIHKSPSYNPHLAITSTKQ